MIDQHKPLLCLAMIVKNEAASIEMTLRSCRFAVDCAVIVDTGSTDRTREIARETMDKTGMVGDIVHAPFVDFATTKNVGLKEGEKRARWVLYMAGDEFLIPPDVGPMLRAFLEANEKSETCPDAFSIDLQYMGSQYSQRRITRSDRGVYYVGRVHEDVMVERQGPILDFVQIFHDGREAHRPENMKARFERDLPLLLADVAERPDWSRAWNYLAKTYMGLRRFKDATEAAYKAVRLEPHPIKKFHMTLVLARALQEDGQPLDKVLDVLKAARVMAPKRSEVYLHTAQVLHLQGKSREAIVQCLAAAALPVPDDNSGIAVCDYSWLPHLMVAELALETREFDLGRQALEKAEQAGVGALPRFLECRAKYQALTDSHGQA